MKNSKIVRSKLLPDLPTKFHFFSVAEVAVILDTSTKSVQEWLNIVTELWFIKSAQAQLYKTAHR